MSDLPLIRVRPREGRGYGSVHEPPELGVWLAARDAHDLPVMPGDRVVHAQLGQRIVDDYGRCSVTLAVSPYMPEFFWVPAPTWRGRQIYRRIR